MLWMQISLHSDGSASYIFKYIFLVPFQLKSPVKTIGNEKLTRNSLPLRRETDPGVKTACARNFLFIQLRMGTQVSLEMGKVKVMRKRRGTPPQPCHYKLAF